LPELRTPYQTVVTMLLSHVSNVANKLLTLDIYTCTNDQYQA